MDDPPTTSPVRDTKKRNVTGARPRTPYHFDFPDDIPDELLQIAATLVDQQTYPLTPETAETLKRYNELRTHQPQLTNARSNRTAIDRARLRQANRVFSQKHLVLGQGTSVRGEHPRSKVFLEETEGAPESELGNGM